jgi:hypothetical protein
MKEGKKLRGDRAEEAEKKTGYTRSDNAFRTMLLPWVGAICTVLPELDPFLAHSAVDPVGFYICQHRIITEQGGTLVCISPA